MEKQLQFWALVLINAEEMLDIKTTGLELVKADVMLDIKPLV